MIRSRWRFANVFAVTIRACLHSLCPEDGGDEVDDGGEAFVGLLVTRGDASKGFYAAEEVFDEMPPLVFFSVMLGISTGPLAERNDGLHVVGAQSFAQPTGIKSLIADQGQAIDAGHESVEAGDVVPLAWHSPARFNPYFSSNAHDHDS